MLLVVTMILDIYASYLGKIIPNISCPWTMSTQFMVEFIDHIHFGLCLNFVLPLAKKMFYVIYQAFLASYGSSYFIGILLCFI